MITPPYNPQTLNSKNLELSDSPLSFPQEMMAHIQDTTVLNSLYHIQPHPLMLLPSELLTKMPTLLLNKEFISQVVDSPQPSLDQLIKMPLLVLIYLNTVTDLISLTLPYIMPKEELPRMLLL